MSKQELGERQKNLVEALRSGDYKQGRGLLRTKEDKFCCLGIACDLIDYFQWQDFGSGYYYTPKEKGALNSTSLNEQVRAYYGFRGHLGKSKDIINFNGLSKLNDFGYTFEQIADIIEAHPEQYFTESL